MLKKKCLHWSLLLFTCLVDCGFESHLSFKFNVLIVSVSEMRLKIVPKRRVGLPGFIQTSTKVNKKVLNAINAHDNIKRISLCPLWIFAPGFSVVFLYVYKPYA